jgi:hypothetical protein
MNEVANVTQVPLASSTLWKVGFPKSQLPLEASLSVQVPESFPPRGLENLKQSPQLCK